MGEHESSIGGTDEWYTPREIFEALKLHFDVDVAFPRVYTKRTVPAVNFCSSVIMDDQDGLTTDWEGMVWMNPPYGGRNSISPWLERFIEHGNGIAAVPNRTACGWWHRFVPEVHAVTLVRGKTKFLRPDGTVGKSPGHGIALLGMGVLPRVAMFQSQLGMTYHNTFLNGLDE